MMRRTLGSALGLMLVFALTGAASAQTTQKRALTLPFANFGAQQVQFQVVDTEQNPVPIARPQTFSNSFSLANIMPSLNPRLNNKTVVGLSQFPSQDGMPGKNYLRAFGYTRAQPIR